MNVFVDSRFNAIYERHPLVLADIGARGGLRPNWRAAARHLRLLGFEPDRTEYLRLSDRARREPYAVKYFDVALHNHTAPLKLHVARDRGLSSVFEPNRRFLDAFPDAGRFDTVDQVTIQADTLDHVIDTQAIDNIDFIKADTQGSELFVLQGGRRALTTWVIGVEVEVEFAPIYDGQPLFADVDAFMRQLGYLLFDLRPCYWKRSAGRGLGGPHGQIVWADALYLKSVPGLREAIGAAETAWQTSKILKTISIALLYGYADYALEVARASTDLLSAEERSTIETRVKRMSTRRSALPRFPGKRRIAAALKRISKRCQDQTDDWSISDADLGNLE